MSNDLTDDQGLILQLFGPGSELMRQGLGEVTMRKIDDAAVAVMKEIDPGITETDVMGVLFTMSEEEAEKWGTDLAGRIRQILRDI